jgi:hypothetical protein
MSGVPTNLRSRGATPSTNVEKRRGCGCLGSITGVILIAVAATVLIHPWALHIGGRWTPALTWHGIGTLHSSSGANYPIFMELTVAMPEGRRGGDGKDLQGSAKICTPQGEVYPLNVTGYFKRAWLTMEGKPVTFYLRSRKDAEPKLSLTLVGQWSGPELQLEDKGNFAMTFAPDGHVKGYLRGTNSPTENTSGALRYATESEFACSGKSGASF